MKDTSPEKPCTSRIWLYSVTWPTRVPLNEVISTTPLKSFSFLSSFFAVGMTGILFRVSGISVICSPPQTA